MGLCFSWPPRLEVRESNKGQEDEGEMQNSGRAQFFQLSSGSFHNVTYLTRFRTRFLSRVLHPNIQLTIEMSTQTVHLSLSPFILCLVLLRPAIRKWTCDSSFFLLTLPLSNLWPSCKEILYSEKTPSHLCPLEAELPVSCVSYEDIAADTSKNIHISCLCDCSIL